MNSLKSDLSLHVIYVNLKRGYLEHITEYISTLKTRCFLFIFFILKLLNYFYLIKLEVVTCHPRQPIASRQSFECCTPGAR